MLILNSENLRSYLLGTLKDGRDSLEERLMIDYDAFELLEAEEEELVQEYVDGELSKAEVERFETYFLISDERVRKLAFAEEFRKKIDAEMPSVSSESLARENSTADNNKDPDAAKQSLEASAGTKKGPRFGFLSGIFASPLPAAVSIIVIAGVAGFAIWNFYLKPSDSEIALVALNKAFAKERPLESRISGFEYAPTRNTRGGDDPGIDSLALDRAENIILRNASENANADNLHALGRLYLSKKEYDKAIEQFEKVEKLDDKFVQNLNDIGVAYLEKSQVVETDAERFELNGRSLSKFDKAIELSPGFSEAFYNKAIAVEQVPLPRQALKAWEEFLKLEPNTKWSEEARRKVTELKPKTTGELDASQLESRFLTLMDKKDTGGSIKLISANRDLIREKYLPQRLAMSFVNAKPSDRKRYLEGLQFLGALENDRIKDRFAIDLAKYYRGASEGSLSQLRIAQNLMKSGYALCLEGKFEIALGKFRLAQQKFLDAGNSIEANTITAVFIAYCLRNVGRDVEAESSLRLVNKVVTDNEYKWLGILNGYWLVGVEESNGESDYFEVTRVLEENLKKSKSIDDLQMQQRLIISLATKSDFVGRDEKTKEYLASLFRLSAQPTSSTRQKLRNYGLATEILAKTSLSSTSIEVAKEGLQTAIETRDPLLILNFQVNNGLVNTQASKFATAARHFSNAASMANSLDDSPIKQSFLGNIALYLGHLERKRGNMSAAADSYDQATKYLKEVSPAKSYEIRKSRLLAYEKLSRFESVDIEISSVLELAEKYRTEIRNESERNAFFDNEQTIYDLAIVNEIRKGNKIEAYDLAEKSSSRSLLDWLRQGAIVKKSVDGADAEFGDTARPLGLREIQAGMPGGVQILQYSIVEEKVIIWLIEKENFRFETVDVDTEKLRSDVGQYRALIVENRDADSFAHLARRLHQVLIAPILSGLDPNKEICIVPSKFLFHLPFVSLIDSKGRYLVEGFTTFYAPSANVFLESSRIADQMAKNDRPKLLVVGNPRFSKNLFTDLQDLPHAEREVKSISKLYDNPTLVLGNVATKDRVLDEASGSDIIHFAGHYVVDNERPLRSGLILANGEHSRRSDQILTNEELMGKRFPDTRLVVLSACDTGAEGFLKGEGLTGLSRSFLAAGVPTVIGSQWKVNSSATAELMYLFHARLRSKANSPAEALRHAQLGMINSRIGEFRFTNQWAAFSVIGG